MIIKEEISLDMFEAWSGGKDTLQKVISKGKADMLEAIIEDEFPDGITTTELNDLLWFETEQIYDWCDIIPEFSSISVEIDEDYLDDEEYDNIVGYVYITDEFGNTHDYEFEFDKDNPVGSFDIDEIEEVDIEMVDIKDKVFSSDNMPEKYRHEYLISFNNSNNKER